MSLSTLAFSDSHSPPPPLSSTPSLGFPKWSSRASHHHLHSTTTATDNTSQCLVKYIFFTVPYLHTKNPDEISPQTISTDTKLYGKGASQEEFSINHVLAEHHRHKKLNHKRGASDLLIIRGDRIERKGKCKMDDLPLSALFEQARKIHTTTTDSSTDQEVVKKGCEALHRCEDMVNNLGLFSPNETKEDINTTNLKYILVRMFEFSYFDF
ncbi:PP2A regulatory subunit TAP46 [Glycine max]|nr:PP2A regulatory subunit TAP46 [Glycine max]